MFEKNVHHSDLSKLENQRGLNTPFETGQLSSAVVDQPITKSREQIVTNEKSGPLKHFGWDFTSRQTRIAVHLFFVIVLLGWWISGIVLKKTRHKWIVTTFWTWLILIIIFFQWIPTRYVSKPIGNLYQTLFEQPVMKATNQRFRLLIAWLALLGLWLASAFGIGLSEGTHYIDRIRCLIGLIVFLFGFWITSNNRKLISWRTVLVGLILQQLLALLVLKTEAGYDFFNWIAKAATDVLDQGTKAGGFFFSAQVVESHWFFVNTLAAIIFFIALVQLLYYLGIMQAVMGKIAWVFQALMGVSGVEAVVAASSPFVGQGENVILVRPFAKKMTTAEIHQVMASGFSTIAGSVLTAYVAMGIPAVYLISSSIMSIPAALSISKLRFPEDGEPLTAGHVVIPMDEEADQKDRNALLVFSDGAWLGLRVAGMILANLLTILALLYTVDGLLTWIGQFWGMDPNGSHPLTLELILQYVLYPVAWLMGTPNQDVLKVSRLLALKMISNEFIAYQELSKIKAEMTGRGFVIAAYSLCGFANLGSLGIQIGVLNSLVPAQKDEITRVAWSALLCGSFSTIQTAAIAGLIF